MKVRTIRKHCNAYPPQYVKNRGRIYEVPDKTARNLISSRLVEEYEPEPEPEPEDEIDAADVPD